MNELTFESLCKLDNKALSPLFESGITPDSDELIGWECRGYNINPMTELLGIRKFKKGFYSEPGAKLLGYNVKVEQNGLLNPWLAKLKQGEPIKHGLFEVYKVRAQSRDNLYPEALLLDYGAGHNPILDPSKVLRDYLVQIYKQNPDLYLGKAYTALGPLRVFSSYFVLERYNKVL